MSAALIDIDEARQHLRFCDSYSRMEVLVDIGTKMCAADWHLVLGEEWTCCDNISQYRLTLRRMLPKQGPVLPMMTSAECARYDELPEVITVYRGCGPVELRGASWSLDRDVAARFPFLNRYRTSMPTLVTATVRKHQVLAVKLDRDEAEIITFGARRIGIERLDGEAA
jgi:hypothetical protein